MPGISINFQRNKNFENTIKEKTNHRKSLLISSHQRKYISSYLYDHPFGKFIFVIVWFGDDAMNQLLKRWKGVY